MPRITLHIKQFKTKSSYLVLVKYISSKVRVTVNKDYPTYQVNQSVDIRELQWIKSCKKQIQIMKWYYLPTPPLGQDMTQGQFLSGV